LDGTRGFGRGGWIGSEASCGAGGAVVVQSGKGGLGVGKDGKGGFLRPFGVLRCLAGVGFGDILSAIRKR
jgi:hypothetical protein